MTLQNDSTASYANRVQYYKIANGMSGTSNSPLVVEVERNKSVETYIGMNSEGEIKKFCLVDFLNS